MTRHLFIFQTGSDQWTYVVDVEQVKAMPEKEQVAYCISLTRSLIEVRASIKRKKTRAAFGRFSRELFDFARACAEGKQP